MRWLRDFEWDAGPELDASNVLAKRASNPAFFRAVNYTGDTTNQFMALTLVVLQALTDKTS